MLHPEAGSVLKQEDSLTLGKKRLLPASSKILNNELSEFWNEMLLKNPNRVRPERVRRGRLRRVSKILETRGNFDEVSEIKKSTIFYRNKFSSLNRAVQSQPTQGNKRPT